MRPAAFFLIILLLPVAGWGDSATSQPSESPELVRLRQENAALKSQIIYLTAENKSLRLKLTAATTKPSASKVQTAGVPTKQQRIAQRQAQMAASGLPADAQERWLADWRKMDEVIEKYIKSHDRPKEVQLSLYKFEPTLGMSESDVDAILAAHNVVYAPPRGPIPAGMSVEDAPYKKVVAESVGERTVYYRMGSDPPAITITFTNDVATIIARPSGNGGVTVTHGLVD